MLRSPVSSPLLQDGRLPAYHRAQMTARHHRAFAVEIHDCVSRLTAGDDQDADATVVAGERPIPLAVPRLDNATSFASEDHRDFSTARIAAAAAARTAPSSAPLRSIT